MAIARSPVFHPSGDSLLFLGSDAVVTHNAAVRLHSLPWAGADGLGAAASPRVLVDTVAAVASADDFPGLYLGRLNVRSCFARGNTAVVVNSHRRSTITAYLVDVASGAIENVGSEVLRRARGFGGHPFACASVVDVCDKGLLFTASSPNAPSTLVFLPYGDAPGTWAAPIVYDRPIVGAEAVRVVMGIRWRLVPVHPSDGGPSFDAILALPPPNVDDAPDHKPPLLVLSHGGPHSSFPAGFSSVLT